MTKQRRHVIKRQKAGLCLYEGCDEDPKGATRCHVHARQRSEAMKRYRAKKKQEAARVDA